MRSWALLLISVGLGCAEGEERDPISKTRGRYISQCDPTYTKAWGSIADCPPAEVIQKCAGTAFGPDFRLDSFSPATGGSDAVCTYSSQAAGPHGC